MFFKPILIATSFTPWLSVIGGLLIGLSSTGLFAFNGRIAGISAMVGNLISPRMKKTPGRPCGDWVSCLSLPARRACCLRLILLEGIGIFASAVAAGEYKILFAG